MSDTPRTGAVIKKVKSYHSEEAFDEIINECAQLERELNAMTKERDEWKRKASQYSFAYRSIPSAETIIKWRKAAGMEMKHE